MYIIYKGLHMFGKRKNMWWRMTSQIINVHPFVEKTGLSKISVYVF